MRVLILALLIVLSGCSTTKEMRRNNRAARKLERLVQKFPELSRTDTIRDTVAVIVPSIEIDTVVTPADTIRLSKDRWHVEIINTTDSVFITGGCETDTITQIVEIPCDTIQPTVYKPLPLKWWQKALMFLGGAFGLYLLILALKRA